MLKISLIGHTGPVNSVTYRPGGRTLASAGGARGDQKVHFWDATMGEIKATLSPNAGSIYSIMFSPDGNTLASSGAAVLLWDIPQTVDGEEEIRQFREDVNRDGVVDLLDLTVVAELFGQPSTDNLADVNEDGVINIADLVLIAAVIQKSQN